MSKKMINTERIEGYVYSHDLSIKEVKNETSANFGKPFISGTIEIAVDEELLNVIPVHFTYVTEMTASGKKNGTYANLKKIIDGDAKTVIDVGKEEAQKVRIDTALALNDFYTQDDQLVSVKQNEGGFVTFIKDFDDEAQRNRFEVDMLITGTKMTDADPEKNINEAYLTLKGAIFNFRNELLPVEFKVTNPKGIEFFEGLGATNAEPIFTKVWGRIISQTKTTVVEEETAFGEAAVKTYERKIKDWIVSGAPKIAYDFGDEEVLTTEEVVKMMQDRETHLAEVKARSDEYKAQKAAGTTSKTTTTNGPKPAAIVNKGGFYF